MQVLHFVEQLLELRFQRFAAGPALVVIGEAFGYRRIAGSDRICNQEAAKSLPLVSHVLLSLRCDLWVL